MAELQTISVLSARECEAIEKQLAHLPDRPSGAIEALRIVQEARGWISDESLKAIAQLLDMSAGELDSIATFYNLIYRKPTGRHVVSVCDSVSCYVMGCDALKKKLEQHLDIKHGETTEDDRFTLIPVVCLGACDRAPAIMIDKDLHGPVSFEDLVELLEGYE